jgi:cytoskeletal protein CcmA (bactofilin family)
MPQYDENAEDNTEENTDQMVNTLDSEAMTNNEEAENEMKEWLEEFIQEDAIETIVEMDSTEVITEDTSENESSDDGIQDDITLGEDIDEDIMDVILEEDMEGEGESMNDKNLKVDENVEAIDNDFEENVDLELLDALNAEEEEQVDEKKVADKKLRAASVANEDDVTVISKGTTINGSISSDGSLEIMGNITGDVECLGKLSITGKIVGNSTAAEVYVNTERLDGSINSEGSVKVGLGTVVVGDIIATSGVIAGAVKGEIDINGPIVIDSTAIIKGNIKAKSVQINNGAVVEGFCSLSYSDVDLDNIFE